MRIVVVGAGAVGSIYGALLARAGNDVALVDIDPAVVAAVREAGVALEAPDGRTERVAVPIGEEPGAADAVLVLTKATATAAVARALAGLDALVVTLQNGLGNDAALAAVLGEERVVRGATTAGGVVRAPGVVRVAGGVLTGETLTTLEGPAAGVQELAAALTAAGLPAEVVADAGQVVWRKLAMAAAIGPLCVVLRCTVADVLERPGAVRALRAGFDELVAVAALEGVVLDREELWAHALHTFRTIGAHRPSLAVDVAAGRPSELDAQAGEVQRRARAAGIPTPALDLVAGIARAIAREAA